MSEQDTVLVPSLVGLDVNEAHALALAARIVVAPADPAHPLPVTGVVTAQEPTAGTRLASANWITIAVDRDPGGGGWKPGRTAPPGPREPAVTT